MNLKELLSRYHEALKSKDFVAMSNLAGLCLQEMPEICRSQFCLDHFGVCPKCLETDGCLHVGRDEWFVCREHKAKWYVGSNLFSVWREMTDEEFKNNEELLESYKDIKPIHLLERNNSEDYIEE